LNFEEVHANILIGLLRLRKISKVAWMPEWTTVPCSIMRELHVYGNAVAVSARDPARKKTDLTNYSSLLVSEQDIIRPCCCH